jgi:hypothetical protein
VDNADADQLADELQRLLAVEDSVPEVVIARAKALSKEIKASRKVRSRRVRGARARWNPPNSG